MTTHETHFPTREEVLDVIERPLPRSLVVGSAVLTGVGALVFLFGALTGSPRPWRALHFNWLFFASVSQAAVIIVAAQRITTARWSRPIIRFLEGYVAFLPVAFLLLILIFIGAEHIFPWTHEAPPHEEKRLYLTPAFLITRDLVMFAILCGLSLWFVYSSVRLDVGQSDERGAAWARRIRDRMRRRFGDERWEIHRTHTLQGRLAVFMCLGFAFFWSVFSWDLSMTLDAHFFSTLYGWWFFMGGWLGAVLTWSLLTMWWRRQLRADDLITEHHFHDLGKLGFAFTAFWGYLTFGQYLVIWYGNLHEETHWMHVRLVDPWKWLAVSAVFLVFVIPFFGLLSRAAKVYLPTHITFAVSGTIGLWLLRYLEVYPSLYPNAASAPMGPYEIGIALGYLGLWGLCYFAFMNAFPVMRVSLMTSRYRDEVQVPYDPDTLEPIPAHE